MQSSPALQADRFTYLNASGQFINSPEELAAVNQGKNTIPAIRTNTRAASNLVVENGSFLRLNNINLGYTFLKKWLSAIKVTNVRIYFTAYNLYVFTKYSGYDPEVSMYGNS